MKMEIILYYFPLFDNSLPKQKMVFHLFILICFRFNKTTDLYKLAGVDYSIPTSEINELLLNISLNQSEIKNESTDNDTLDALKILNNTYLRRIYDLYGAEALENPHEFEGNQKETLKIQKTVPIYDFYTGCRYFFTFTRTRICKCPNNEKTNKPTFMCSLCHGSTTIQESVPIELNLKKGSADPFIFTLPNMTDATEKYSPGNIKIILKSEPTPFYSRRVNDIFVFALEPYSSIKPGLQLSYYFIDDKIHTYNVTEVHPLIKVEGKGMPIEGTDRYGDLFIYFN